MGRKSLSKMDGASSEFSRAASKKAGSFAKKGAKKLLHSGAKKAPSSRKSKQADADATVLLLGLRLPR